MNPSRLNIQEFQPHFSATLSDYITAIAYSPTGTTLAATSSAGEVVLWENGELVTLQAANDTSVDCLGFCQNGDFLAVSGQDGQVKIWRDRKLIATLENFPAWVDQLAWNPTSNLLAFSLGKKVQIWDADTRKIVASLNFESSSALGIDWCSDGKYLAICGHRGVKVWDSQDWKGEPYILDIPSASVAMAWSMDGKYLATANMDRTLFVVETQLLISEEDPQPWVMHGFPGKVRQLAWSEPNSASGAPLLASCSMDGIVVWEVSEDDSLGWEANILTNHVDIINAIAFAPNSFLLASGGADGWLCLWQNVQEVGQILTGVSSGFSCLAWHPQGKQIAAGGNNGELLVWSKATEN